jgi:predicted P-loop ATPase
VYLKDPTGNRRSWPWKTGIIDIAKLKGVRGALFAEALEVYRAGGDAARYWPNREEERTLFQPEQDDRFDADEWESIIVNHLDGNHNPNTRTDKTTAGALGRDVCGVITAKLDRQTQLRIVENIGAHRLGARPAHQGRSHAGKAIIAMTDQPIIRTAQGFRLTGNGAVTSVTE